MRILMVIVLGALLFAVGAYSLGLFEGPAGPGPRNNTTGASHTSPVTPEKELGADLYTAAAFPKFEIPKRKSADPIILQAILNPRDQEEVPSQVPGRVLFIGEEVDQDIAPLAGSAPLIAEPYYFAVINAGRQKFVKFYRQLYDGEIVHKDQMLGMMDPSEAVGVVLEKLAKIEASKADKDAAEFSESEAKTRWDTAKKLYATKSIAEEDYRSAVLTFQVKRAERIAKEQGVNLAEYEKDQADIKLDLHRIRAYLPSKSYVIKNIVRQRGYYVKQMDPVVMSVLSLDRLQAEALIDQAYFARLNRPDNKFRATIEPTILEKPLHELPGHARDITSVAVAKDMKIVSGSEDRSVCVWTREALAPVQKLEHEDAVLVVACTPPTAQANLCLAGCQDGSITIWNLAGESREPLARIPEAHGKDVSITSLAISPDGAWFASGASDGSLKLWSVQAKGEDGKEKYGVEKYAFIPENGVEQGHQGDVTALHFTPQCRLVSAGKDNTIRIWKLKEKGAVEDGKTIRFRQGNIANLGVSQDGKWMLFDRGRSLQIWSVETRQLVHAINAPVNSTPFDTLAMFSPDGSMVMTANASEGRLQLWRTPDENLRGFEVRQFSSKARDPISCAAFSPEAGKGGGKSFAVSASGQNLYLWTVPSKIELTEHRIQNVPLTFINRQLDPTTDQIRIGFEVLNPTSEQYPNGRFEAGRPVTIVIE